MVFTADHAVAQAAIAQVASCEACNPDADWPFEAILDHVMLFSGVHTDYFMPEPPACPRCKATLTEKTLVEMGVLSSRGRPSKEKGRQLSMRHVRRLSCHLDAHPRSNGLRAAALAGLDFHQLDSVRKVSSARMDSSLLSFAWRDIRPILILKLRN